MMPSDELWRDLRDAEDDALRRSTALERVRERMPRTVPQRRRRPYWAAGLVAAASLVLALLAVIGMPSLRRESPALHFSIGSQPQPGRLGEWIAAPDRGALPLSFSDGTRVTLETGARARVASTSAAGAHVVIERGRAVADVVHRADTRWRVDVGPFQVDVVGTRFELGWDPTREILELELRAGAVLVSGSFLQKPVFVAQGQRLWASRREMRVEVLDAHGTEATAPQPSAGVDDEVGRARTASPPEQGSPTGGTAAPAARREPTWQELAKAGKYSDALGIVERLGFGAECRRASGEDLVLLGDAARLAGASGRAREAYLSARGKTSGAGRSAYGLGLLADQRGNAAESARWFRTYLAEQPRGPLRAEAQGRLMEALQRSGDHAGARGLARDYLISYPNGSHAVLARELLSR